jgi:hypothetical protein
VHCLFALAFIAAEPVAEAAATEPASEPASAPASLAAAPASEAVEAPASAESTAIATVAPTTVAPSAAAPASAPVKAVLPGPGRRTAVSAAVNADQAALSGQTKKAWSVLLTFNTSLGIGSFLSAQTTKAAYVGSTLTVEPAYVFSLPKGLRVRAGVRESLSLEYTPPDEPTGRRVDYSDLLLGASARLYKIPKIDVDLWGSYRMPIPISLDSIQAGLITAIITGAGASRNFEWTVKGDWRMSLTVRYDFVFRKNFNRFNVPVYQSSNDPYAPTLIARSDDTIVQGGVGRGGANTNMTLTNGLTVSWTPWDFLSVTLFASITNGFRYAITDTPDFYTPPYATAGPGRFDLVRTNVDFTFTLMPQLLLSAGLFTAQPPFAPDNKTLYNPWLNTQSAANNYSQLYVSLTAVL